MHEALCFAPDEARRGQAPAGAMLLRKGHRARPTKRQTFQPDGRTNRQESRFHQQNGDFPADFHQQISRRRAGAASDLNLLTGTFHLRPFHRERRRTKEEPKAPISGPSAFCGTPGAIRTRDLPLRRRTLYPAELRKHICGAYLFYPIRRAKSTEICAAFPGGCLRQAFPRLFGLKSPRSACPGAFCPGLFCAAPAPAAGAKSSVLPTSFPAPPQDAALLASCLSSLSEPTVGRRHKAF